MGTNGRRLFIEEFKRKTVRLVETSSLTTKQVSEDLGIGLSTLTVASHLSGPHDEVNKKLARLHKENEILRTERDLLKKATAFFAKETSPLSAM